MFRAELSENVPKTEASGFRCCCVLNNTQFLKASHGNQKKFMMSGKLGTSANKIIYAKVTFSWWRFVYQASELQPMLSINKVLYVEDTFCYKDYVCQVSKLQHMYVIGLKLIFSFKFKWKVLKQINPNLVGLSRSSFLPPCSNETTSLKTIPSFEFAYVSCILYIRLLWPISVLTKNLSRRKKVYIKVFQNRFILILPS